MMNLSLSQRDTTYRSIGKKPRRVAWLRRSPQRSKPSRLRRRGPRWVLAALLLLAADAVLAIIVWLVVERLVR
ncbi:hypothetical protein SAMN05443248_5042 [Bradyrhizobium erythrophlei]|uniref:Uncharacterized protein n=1 Tax=Bradyrhizobium erythrophlei TaxID=1437360 RepID=A0A1M5TJI0_9BRAD|nr:hypothetical protein SAMN05443248_5042 [Bradyrhizobium erythrophlei]